ncbi:MAG: serine hydrolase [Fulvivirga sp.]
MKKAIFSISFIFVFLLTFAQTNQERADAIIKEALPNNEHGVAVLVARDGEILYEKYAGYANVKKQTAVEANTTFRIGSVTKQFTAAAILKLVEQGKMQLEDPLNKYIDDFPRGDKITIHHLLNHTSGIKSYTDQPDFIKSVGKSVATKELVDEIKALGFDFEPGEQWKYNNSAYYILGYLIEQQSGMSYEAFLKKHFFEPAGMENTGVYDNAKKYKMEALGYANEEGKMKLSMDWDMTRAGGAGNMYSTVTDLLKWNNFVFSGKAVRADLLEKAHTQLTLNDGSNYPYGYGWGVGAFRGLEQIAHSGGLHGFLTWLAYYPEIDVTVAVTSNASPPLKIVPGQLGKDMLEVFFEDQLESREEAEIDVEELQKYVGKYEYPGGAIMTVTQEEDKLFAQLTGQQRFQLFSEGENKFFWKVVDAQIEFHVADNGEVEYGMHAQGGMEMKVPKIEEQEAITMTPKEFKKFEGEYVLNGASVKVWEENGSFYTQIQGQPKFEIHPKSDYRFFMKELAVEIEFAEGDKSESFTLYQGGREVVAKRK